MLKSPPRITGRSPAQRSALSAARCASRSGPPPCRLATHTSALRSRTAWTQRRSGHTHSRRHRCSATVSPRTRIALAPPPPDLIASGHRVAIARRIGSSALREVSTSRWSAPRRAPSAGGHHGGTSWSSATSHSHPASASANSSNRSRPAGGTDAAVQQVPGQHAHRLTTQRTLVACRATSSPGPSSPPTSCDGCIDRALELKAAPYSSDALHKRAVALIFEKPSTRTRVSFEAGITELGATRWCCAPTSSSSRAGSRCATPPTFSPATRRRSGSGPARDELIEELAAHATVPVINMLTARSPPVPGARRPAHAARDLRPRSTG